MDSYVDFAGAYDALTTDVPYGTFADFYELIFEQYGIKPVSLIDLACGTGTLTEILCRRGYDMTAVDASNEMLAVAMEKFWDLENRPLVLCQRLEELDLYGTVDAAVCSLDAVNYISPDVLPRAFDRIRLFLEPGGVFIFDINSPKKLKDLDGQMFIDERDDAYCVWRAVIDEEINACVYGVDLFRKKGSLWKRSREEHIEYIHEPNNIVTMLKNAGMTDINMYGELALQPTSENEQRIFFAARKPF